MVVVITFRVSRRRCEMYFGHARLCVCVSVCLSVCGRMPTLLHGPGCNLGSGRGCPLVVHYWADLQAVHGLRCYGNTRNAWQCPAAIRQAHRTPHALRTCWRRLPSPAITSTRLLRSRRHLRRGRSISSILRECCNANAKCYRVHACTRSMLG